MEPTRRFTRDGRLVGVPMGVPGLAARPVCAGLGKIFSSVIWGISPETRMGKGVKEIAEWKTGCYCQWAGLGDIPVLGDLFSRNHKEAQQTDVVIMLTPHIIRVLDLTEDDLRPLRIPREGGGSGGIGVEPFSIPAVTPAQPPRAPNTTTPPPSPIFPAPGNGN